MAYHPEGLDAPQSSTQARLLAGPSSVYQTLSPDEQEELRELIAQTLHHPWIEYLEECQPGIWVTAERELVLCHRYRWYLERYPVTQEQLHRYLRQAETVPLLYVQQPDVWPGSVHLALASRTGDLQALSRAIPYLQSGHPMWTYWGPDPEEWWTALQRQEVPVHLQPWLFEHPSLYYHLAEYQGPVDGIDWPRYLLHCHEQGWPVTPLAYQWTTLHDLLRQWWQTERTLEETLRLLQGPSVTALHDDEPLSINHYLVYLGAYHSRWQDGHRLTARNRQVTEQLERLAGDECHYEGCIVSRREYPELQTIYRYRGYYVGVGERYRSDSLVHERCIDRLISGLQPALLP